MFGGKSPYAGLIQQQRGLAAGGGIRPAPRPQAAQRQPGGGGGGGMSAMMPAAMGAMGGMMSDERSKKEIARLDAQNQALTKALSSQASYPDTSAPSPGMQALGQQSAAPSRASFADSPAANTVAAQNVALSQAAAPPAAPAMPPKPGFDVSRGMPDLAALDEAYRNMGRNGG